MPASSPGPRMTSGLSVGKRARNARELLYEQCSLHCASNACNSTSVGSRSRRAAIVRASGTLSASPCARSSRSSSASSASLTRKRRTLSAWSLGNGSVGRRRRSVELLIGLHDRRARVGLHEQGSAEENRVLERQ